MTIKVAFWNRLWRGNRDRQVDYLLHRAPEWEVLLLAETTRRTFMDFSERLDCVETASGLMLRGESDQRIREW